jgi:hypothetical protein
MAFIAPCFTIEFTCGFKTTFSIVYVSSFKATRELYGKTGGNEGHVIIQSFKPGEVTPELSQFKPLFSSARFSA